MPEQTRREHLARMVNVIGKLLDPDIFTWIPPRQPPTKAERHLVSTIVADRLTGAVANPIVRNAQEKRQFDVIAKSW